MKTKLIKELEVGDRLELEDGSIGTIKEIAKGLYFNSKLLTFTNGLWSCQLNNDIVKTIS